MTYGAACTLQFFWFFAILECEVKGDGFVAKFTYRILYQLQTALANLGYVTKMTTSQFYSEERHRYLKYYVLRDNDGEILVKTYNTDIIVKFFADKLKELQETGEESVDSGEEDTED